MRGEEILRRGRGGEFGGKRTLEDGSSGGIHSRIHWSYGCRDHRSLGPSLKGRVWASGDGTFGRCIGKTPAQAEGLTDGRLYANSRDPGKRERLRAQVRGYPSR